MKNNKTVNIKISGCNRLERKIKKTIFARQKNTINQTNKSKIKIKIRLKNGVYIILFTTGDTNNASKNLFKTAHNQDLINTFCNDQSNTFQYACHQLYLSNNP